LQTAALNQRIDKIEDLLVELKSALPLSARNANVQNRPIDQPMDSEPSNFDSPAGQSSRLGPMSDLPKRCSLPPMEEGQALLTDYLRDFNSKVPLLAPEAIVSHMRDCYSGAAKGIASSWVRNLGKTPCLCCQFTKIICSMFHPILCLNIFLSGP
jgi:hypothetical protein